MTNTQQDKDNESVVTGTIVEALPNTMFKIELSDGSEQLAYLSGKMRIHRIKVLVGDKVAVKLDPYGGKGRVVKRL
jgi:translation initiation factor IF-1